MSRSDPEGPVLVEERAVQIGLAIAPVVADRLDVSPQQAARLGRTIYREAFVNGQEVQRFDEERRLALKRATARTGNIADLASRRLARVPRTEVAARGRAQEQTLAAEALSAVQAVLAGVLDGKARELEPEPPALTLGAMRARGARNVVVGCGCGRRSKVTVDKVADDVPVAVLARRFRCTACAETPVDCVPHWPTERDSA